MRYFALSSLLFILAFQSCLASTVQLYVDNRSKDAITIIKSNGEHLVVPPNGYVEQVPFEEYSHPMAFVGNKYICSWEKLYSKDNLELEGLTYDNPYGAQFYCLTMFIQHNKVS